METVGVFPTVGSAADLREEIAQCRHRGMHEACMGRYIDLVTRP